MSIRLNDRMRDFPTRKIRFKELARWISSISLLSGQIETASLRYILGQACNVRTMQMNALALSMEPGRNQIPGTER